MIPISPFLYKLLKRRHDAKIVNLKDIKNIKVKNVDKYIGQKELPIEITLHNGETIKHKVIRKDLSKLGNAKGNIEVTQLDTTTINNVLNLQTIHDYIHGLFDELGIERLELSDIYIVATYKNCVLLRANPDSLLYYNTVTIKKT